MKFKDFLEEASKQKINEKADTEEVIVKFNESLGLNISVQKNKELFTTIYLSKKDLQKLIENEKVKSLATFSY